MSDSIADTDLNEVSTDKTTSDPTPGGQETTENKGGNWFDSLLADAPEDDGGYIDHALNFDKTESTAKIVRGIEGFIGNLDKAIVLILIGLLEKFNENMDTEKNEQDEQDFLGDDLETN